MQNKQFHFQIAVKSVEEQKSGSVIISGFASTPDMDRYRDIVEPSAFKNALEMYMKNPIVLRSHDGDRPVGSVLSATVTSKGLKVKAEIMDKQTAEEIRDGRMRAMSIGYIPLVTELMVEKDDGSLRAFNPKKDSFWDSDVVRVLKELDLVEISIVSTPANGNALFTIEKSLKSANNMVACKAFNINEEDSMKMKTKSDEAAQDEKVQDEEAVKPEDEKVDEEVDEKVESEETAAEGDDNDSEEATEEESKDAEEAENGDESSPADDAESDESEEKSEEEDAEEADADAEPQDEEEESEDSEEKDEEEDAEEKALLILDAKDMENLSMLKNVGAIRAAVGEEKGEALSTGAKRVLELADKALELAEKHITEQEAKLDKFADKKALSPHAQFDENGEDEEKKSKSNAPAEPSAAFKGLFNLN